MSNHTLSTNMGKAVIHALPMFILLELFHVSRMMFENSFTKSLSRYVGIYLGGAYRLVSEECLNDTQVGTSLEKSGGKRMAKGMG